jgi:hypothetical protein
MRIKLYTLVDITETGARRSDDAKLFRQQQNFLTVMQTIGLRVNPIYIKPPSLTNTTPKMYNLGTSYKGNHNIWEYVFEIEHEGALSEEILINDFNLIPIIDQLTETVKFDNAVFITKNPNLNNIYFEIDDK